MKTIWHKDYAMVFWASTEREPVETVLKLNSVLSQYGDDYIFKYLNDHIEVQIDRESLEKRCIPANANDKRATQSYFSRNLLWFSLSTGVSSFTANSYHKLPEVMKIEFDVKHLEGANPTFNFDQLQGLFRYCVNLFEPYYGRLQRTGEVNYPVSSYREIANKIDLSKVPVAVEWINYFGAEWVERFTGMDKILSAPVFSVERVPALRGAILVLQEEPFDYKNSEHLQRRQIVEDYLNLKRFQEMFKKK